MSAALKNFFPSFSLPNINFYVYCSRSYCCAHTLTEVYLKLSLSLTLLNVSLSLGVNDTHKNLNSCNFHLLEFFFLLPGSFLLIVLWTFYFKKTKNIARDFKDNYVLRPWELEGNLSTHKNISRNYLCCSWISDKAEIFLSFFFTREREKLRLAIN